jgi:hypothetical protein
VEKVRLIKYGRSVMVTVGTKECRREESGQGGGGRERERKGREGDLIKLQHFKNGVVRIE